MINRATITGVLAGLFTVSLWGSLPVLRSLGELPPMLVASVAMVCAAAMSAVLGAMRPSPETAAMPRGRGYWLAGVGGLVGALYFYFLALEGGDPARITLVTYTWPLGFVLICDRLAGHGLRLRTLLGAAVAFVGLAPLLMADAEGAATSAAAYAAGLASGVSWIAFSVFLRQHGGLSARGYQRLFLHAGVIALALHMTVESTPATTTTGDWLTAALIGIGPYGLAFIAWGYALRCGPASLLGVLTYLVPIIAAALLVVLGWSAPSGELLLAAAAVTTGALLSQGAWPRRAR